MTCTDLATGAEAAKPSDLSVTPADNPWTLTVTHAATVLRRSPSAVRRWCAAGWYVGDAPMARKLGGEWMIHGARFAEWLIGGDA